MVINLDKSRNRRRKMRADFAKHGLPEFERVPGVLVTEVGPHATDATLAFILTSHTHTHTHTHTHST